MKLYCTRPAGHPPKHEAWAENSDGTGHLVRAWDDSDTYEPGDSRTGYRTQEDAATADRLGVLPGTEGWTAKDAAYLADGIHLAMSARAHPGYGRLHKVAALMETIYPGDHLDALLQRALENPLFRAEWQKRTS